MSLLAVTGEALGVDASGTNIAPSPHLQAIVTWAAPFDLLRIAELQNTADDPGTMSAQLLGGALATHRETANQANPQTYLPFATPPFLIVHGEDDRLVPPSQAVEMHEALRSNGSSSTLLLAPGKGHGFLGLNALRRSFAFLDQHLKQPGIEYS